MDILEALKQKYGMQVKLPIDHTHREHNKCYGCIFNGEYQDMGACTPICDRESDFLKAFEVHSSKNPCMYYITRQDVIVIQDAILTEKGDDSSD